MTPRAILLLVLCLSLAACSQSHIVVDLPAAGAEITATLGRAGGTLSVDGVELRVPPGALASDTSIRMVVTSTTPPSFLEAFSPVVRFEPEGLTFAEPVELRLPFAGDAALATVFWSAREGSAFVARSTRVEGSVAIAQSSHFSEAFVGTACTGDDCCDRANGVLDLVMMVDDSSSMSEEQASLEAQIPRLARALATGDIEGDGVQDFPALESVRVGVVTSDMGTGGYAVPTCDRGTFGVDFGDDGVLLTRGRDDLPGCAASYPAFAEIGADDIDPSDTTALDAFTQHVSCVATVGTGGCGFEQQLDAVLKATTPSVAPITFAAGTLGHADVANAGFLRDDSMLAFLMMTDEDDCSALDPELFDSTSSTYAADLNLRCFMYPGAVHPISRHVGGLLALRTNPADVIYAAITGVSPEALAETEGYDALLAHPSMIEQIDPAGEPTAPRLAPSCSVPGRGQAMPPRRIVGVARDLDAAGAGTVVASICEEDFTPVIDAILARVASRARGECR